MPSGGILELLDDALLDGSLALLEDRLLELLEGTLLELPGDELCELLVGASPTLGDDELLELEEAWLALGLSPGPVSELVELLRLDVALLE